MSFTAGRRSLPARSRRRNPAAAGRLSAERGPQDDAGLLPLVAHVVATMRDDLGEPLPHPEPQGRHVVQIDARQGEAKPLGGQLPLEAGHDRRADAAPPEPRPDRQDREPHVPRRRHVLHEMKVAGQLAGRTGVNAPHTESALLRLVRCRALHQLPDLALGHLGKRRVERRGVSAFQKRLMQRRRLRCLDRLNGDPTLAPSGRHHGATLPRQARRAASEGRSATPGRPRPGRRACSRSIRSPCSRTDPNRERSSWRYPPP